MHITNGSARLAVAALCVTLAAPAAAQTRDAGGEEGPVTVSVAYSDLDVTRDPGAQALLRRIEAAAGVACGGAPDIRRLGERLAFDRCRRAAVTRAVRGLDVPALTAAAGAPAPVIRVARR